MLNVQPVWRTPGEADLDASQWSFSSSIMSGAAIPGPESLPRLDTLPTSTSAVLRVQEHSGLPAFNLCGPVWSCHPFRIFLWLRGGGRTSKKLKIVHLSVTLALSRLFWDGFLSLCHHSAPVSLLHMDFHVCYLNFSALVLSKIINLDQLSPSNESKGN